MRFPGERTSDQATELSPSDSAAVQNIKLVAKTGTHRWHNVNLSAIIQKLLAAILNKLSVFEVELERLSR